MLLHEVDGQTHEPYERITVDIPPDYIGEIQHAWPAVAAVSSR